MPNCRIFRIVAYLKTALKPLLKLLSSRISFVWDLETVTWPATLEPAGVSFSPQYRVFRWTHY